MYGLWRAIAKSQNQSTAQIEISEAILMSTHNIRFYKELTEIIFQLGTAQYLSVRGGGGADKK